MATTEIWTYQDAVDYVLDHWDVDKSGRTERLALIAARNALQRLAHEKTWSYYERRGQIVTDASQSTGTVAYDHTGGAYERVVTLTGATFPTYAWLYGISISNKQYKIEDYKSTTEVTLTQDSNPGSDVAAGESYNLYRSAYQLPIGTRRIGPLVELAQAYRPSKVTPEQLLDHMAGNWSPSRPQVYTVRSAGEYYGALEVEFAPPPSTSRTYDYMAEMNPRDLKVYKYSTGTVSITANTTALTGSGTTWTSDHVGCIVRLSADGVTEPTSEYGNRAADGTSVENAFAQQRVVHAVDSATSITLDAAVGTTYSAVKYTISDPVDIEPHAMLTLFLRYMEIEFGKAHRADRKTLAQMEADAHIELLRAKIADNRNRQPNDPSGDQYRYTLEDWAIEEAAGGSPV